MILSPKQKRVIAYYFKYKPKITILEGAVRSGKTYVNNWMFVDHVHNFKSKDFIITGHTISSIERNIIKPLYDDLDIKVHLTQRNNFELFDNKIHCFGADKSDSYQAMTGMTSFGWYGNEITLQHPNTIKEAFNRCSGDGFLIFWDTNPDYPDHPIKINYVDKTGEKLDNGQIRIKAHHFALDDNIHLNKDYIENLKKSTPKGMWYNRRILGLWVAAEGVVYENFDKEIHVIESFKIPDTWERIRGIDFGYTNPFCMLWGAIDNDGRLYIYQEHFQAQMLIKDHVKKIQDIISKISETPVTEVGHIIESGEEIILILPDGSKRHLQPTGLDHFKK